ncbi:MAG: septum formation initiator family protein [Desulfitobacteriaceae bacterium]|nr:septum formation initiator family protein [Desulfitobacteriaceae bacterium]MDI6878060.1 septum formation initiator family protein [Desulfitobacteriaceae bacterium]MDI6913930.1 septum formation initiator family protein [Desulfitobacteriaceae bacterium]
MKKKQSKKHSFPRLWRAVSIVAFGILVSTGWNLWQLRQHVEAQLLALTKEKGALVEKQQKLQTEIERLNEPTYIEQLAREQLGLVRHGEITIAPKN